MSNEFSVIELRRRFANAFPSKPLIYWSDLLISAGIGWGAFVTGVYAPVGSPLCLVSLTVSVAALLRSAIFIHEIAHLKDRSLKGFSTAWHCLVGLPLLLPSLMYLGSHNDHHRQPTFGTVHDPEYAPLARWSRFLLVRFFLGLVIVPFLLMLRWGVLGPLSFLHPPLRRWLIACASTLVINPDYRRPQPQGKLAVRWVVQEVAVAMTCWGIFLGVYWAWLPLRWMMQWYVVVIGILLVNQVRTLAAHRYVNEGDQLDATAQLLDSVTLSGWSIVTVLAAPVGLRFHALHHLLPTVPYHSLGALHRQLLAELPPDSPYAQTQERGIFAAVWKLLHSSSVASAMLTVEGAASWEEDLRR